MLIVVADSEGDVYEDTVVRNLRGGGFEVVTAQFGGVEAVVEVVARSKGRIDAIALIGFLPDVLAKVVSIRALSENLVFRGGVRARTTPVALIPFDKGTWSSHGDHTPWVSSLRNLPSFTVIQENAREEISEAVARAIRLWRDGLIAELDYVGFTVTVDDASRLQVSHALTRKRREGEILAPEGTPGSLRQNQFLLLAEDMLEQFTIYSELKYLIENYAAISRREGVQPETIFQRFFEKNPHLVKRGLFERLWAKPKLRIPEAPNSSYAPDFVMSPSVGAHIGTNWEILDLKLPDDKMITASPFHPAYASKLTRAIQQLRNYREYFSRPDEAARRELVTRFGYQPVNPRIAVLMGRREREGGLDQVQRDDLDIDVITYDDIVEFEGNRLIAEATIAGLFGR